MRVGTGWTSPAVAVVVAAAFQAILTVWPDGGVVVRDVGLIVASGMAAVVTGRRALRDPGRARWAWRFASLAMASWCVSRLMYLPEEVLRGQPLEHPAPADVPHMLAYVFTVATALSMPGAQGSAHGRLRTLLDGVMVTSSALGLAWIAVLGDLYERSGGDWHGAMALIYPTTAVVVMSVALLLAGRRPQGDAMALLYGGIAVVAGSTALSVLVELHEVPVGPAGLDGGLLLGVLLFALSARRPVIRPDTRDWQPATAPARAMPYVPVVLLLVAGAALQATGRELVAVVVWSGITTICCLLGRQFVTMEMNAALTRQLQRQRGELAHQAVHDSLTGAGNRVLLYSRMRERLGDPARTGADAVLLVDLDGFKAVNDTYGHAAGDAVLVAVTGRMRSAVGERGTVTRLGGDEFVILAHDVTEERAAALAEDLLIRLRGPVALADTALNVRASIGLTLVPAGENPDPDALLQHADLALYEAKAAGKDCARIFAPGTQAAVAERMLLDGELREALGHGEFVLYYQPIVALDGSGRDGSSRVTGVEALLRWRHPRRGLLVPPQFLHRAEALKLMPALTRWTLLEACSQAARWGIAVNVNISASQVLDPGLVTHVRDALIGAGLAPEMLTLEITEHAIIADLAGAATRLSAVKALGVRLALDDFGTGYSSLTHLSQLSIDVIKIDKSFVDGVTDPDLPAVAAAVLQIAGTLGLVPVAEGVERPDQADRLTALGCGHAQGYYFARPMDSDAVSALLSGQRVGA